MNATRDSELDVLIQEVLDGVATSSGRKHLERLLERDPGVRARYDELRATFARLDSLASVRPSPDASRHARAHRTASVRTSRTLLVAAALAALALGLGLWPTVSDQELARNSTGALLNGDASLGGGALRWDHRDLTVELRAGRTAEGVRVHVMIEPSGRLPDRGVPVELAVDPQRWRVAGVDASRDVLERPAPGTVRTVLVPGRPAEFDVDLEAFGAVRRPVDHVDVSVSARAVVHEMRVRVENPLPVTNSGDG